MFNRKAIWLRPLLIIVGFLYGFVVTVRNILFDIGWFKSKSFRIPVISIGNITVGGTGKTPHVEYLLNLLLPKFQVAVLSRGYKRKSSGFKILDVDTGPDMAGDEPCQMKHKFPEASIAVDANRVRGIESLKKHIPALQVVLLDDAFQHRYVSPGLNILLIDYNRPPFEDRMLPAGDMRESFSSIQRADMIIVTKTPEKITPIDQRIFTRNLDLYPYQTVFYTTLKYYGLKPVFPEKEDMESPEKCPDKWSVVAVSGIAVPDTFEQRVAKMFQDTHFKRFPDHHYYTRANIASIENHPGLSGKDGKRPLFITTEKDAIRLVSMQKHINYPSNWFYLPVGVMFLGGGESKFDKEIVNYVSSNRRYSVLHR